MAIPDYYQPMRRIVTGVDSTGHSCLVVDSQATQTEVTPDYVLDDLWSMGLPAEVAGSTELPEPPGADITEGVVLWRRCTIPAGVEIGFHSTDTVDWVTVLSGAVTLLLESGQVDLSPGDCVVQRNTLHGWRNHGTEPCILIAAMASVAG